MDAPDDCHAAMASMAPAAAEIGISLTDQSIALLAEYCRQIVLFSRHTNITGVRSPGGIARTLVLDSLSLLPALGPSSSPHTQVLDVGSGAGIPGIPLAIARPAWVVTLIDSTQKKVAFLRQAVRALGLHNVQAHSVRAELYGRGEGRERFDLTVARAVAPLPTLVELCAPLARLDGILALPRGGDVQAEVRAAAAAARALKVDFVHAYHVPPALGLGTDRYVVIYVKTGRTPPGYPRRVGLATGRPILAPPSTAARPRAETATPRSAPHPTPEPG